MNPERWQKLDELFHAALDVKPEGRLRFVAEACGSDEALRKELESMLEHYEKAGSFIDFPAYVVAAEAIVADESLVGKSFGPYQITQVLGKGGMGIVYLALDQGLHRQIALKFLHDDLLNDKQRVQRFKQEARAASALNHPNILTVHEIGQSNSTHFIATEFVAGETLRERLAGGRMKVLEAVDIATQASSALTAAHAAGITHRDIKPENIMLRPDGYVKVLDFGLAKLTDRSISDVDQAATTRAADTDPGVVMGTVKYMSPEQAQGLPVDSRTDIWSLGAVLYEMIAGCPPFEGATPSHVTVSILERKPSPLSRYASEVPGELEWMISKALRKDREERYQTAKDLMIDLRYLRQQIEINAELERSVAATDAVGAIDTTPNVSKESQSGKKTISSPSNESAASSSGRRQSRKVINSLAVLPLANASADPNAEYLSDGITESIINSLSQLPKLRVVPRSTVFRYKGQEVDPQLVGHDLGVRAVLTGRLLQMGDQLIIKMELIDVLNESQLWGEQYNRKLSDILEVEEQISREISEKLRLKLTGEDKKRLTKRFTKNTDAYHAYLKGRYYWNKRTPDTIQRGIEFFQKAISLDPHYALAYCGLADSYLLLGAVEYGGLRPMEAVPRVRDAVLHALQLDDALAEAHTSLGNISYYDWDWQLAEREYKRAIELNPNYATAHHWYANQLMAHARFDEGLKQIKRAQELDPLSLPIVLGEGWLLFLARQYDQAIEEFRKVIELEPNFANSHLCLGLAYEQKQKYDEAIEELQKAIQLSDSPLMRAALGHAYALSGKTAKARQIRDEMIESSKQKYISPVLIAAVCAGLGEKEEAFAWLEKAYEEHSEGLFWFKVEPSMNNLRSDPRYDELLQRMGFTV